MALGGDEYQIGRRGAGEDGRGTAGAAESQLFTMKFCRLTRTEQSNRMA